MYDVQTIVIMDFVTYPSDFGFTDRVCVSTESCWELAAEAQVGVLEDGVGTTDVCLSSISSGIAHKL